MTEGASQEPGKAAEAASDRARRKGSMGPRSLRGRIVAGILLIIPLAVTAIIIKYVYTAALSVGVWLVWAVSLTLFRLFAIGKEPLRIDPSKAAWQEITVAVALTLLMLYMLGWLGTNVGGRRIIELIESLVGRIPMVDTIYVSVKRMVEAMSGVGKSGGTGQSVVLIDFPNEHMKTLAIMTNTITDSASGRRYAAVYVPTTPNPTSGYMELVPLERITGTDLTMDQALSMILSGGASSPETIRFMKPGPSGKDGSRSSKDAGRERPAGSAARGV